MTPPATSCAQLLQLSRCLSSERLLIDTERTSLQQLNHQLQRHTEQLFQLSWTTRRQLSNLHSLLLARLDNSPPIANCVHHVRLSSAEAVAAHRRLGHHEPLYSQLLVLLRDTPSLVAGMMLQATSCCVDSDHMQQLVDAVYAGLYGGCFLTADMLQLLLLLKQLMADQLCPAAGRADGSCVSPRRLLRRGTCAFSRLYRVFSEGLHEARLFLTAALHEPVMCAVMNDGESLHIKSGDDQPQTSSAAADGSSDARSTATEKLASLTASFVSHIVANIDCFPVSLAWIARTLHSRLVRPDAGCGLEEAAAVVIDLVFTDFICPAIVDPVQYGIIKAPVSPTARHNLIQVGQMLQVLAMSQWRQCYDSGVIGGCDSLSPPTLCDLPAYAAVYKQLDQCVIGDMLRRILSVSEDIEQLINTSSSSPLAESDCVDDFSSQMKDVRRTCVVISARQLNQLVTTARATLTGDFSMDTALRQRLGELLTPLPSVASFSGGGDAAPGSSSTWSLADHSQQLDEDRATGAKKRSILNKVQNRILLGSRSGGGGDSGGDRNHCEEPLSVHRPSLSAAFTDHEAVEVLVVPLTYETSDIGLLSEDAVLANDTAQETVSCCRGTSAAAINNVYAAEGRCEQINGKCGRFISPRMSSAAESRVLRGATVDDISVDTASDNVEVVSEVTSQMTFNSRHNSSSSTNSRSADDAADADGVDEAAADLSDMLSANVSDGRQTPNVSGRNTPLSPSADEDFSPSASGNNIAATSAARLAAVRNGIDDRFGKFSIRPSLSSGLPSRSAVAQLAGVGGAVDETASSQASDTWSTDVLACSDIDGAELQTNSAGVASAGVDDISPFIEVCTGGGDGGSEAWSTDVIASDTERDCLAEVLETESQLRNASVRPALGSVKPSASFSGTASPLAQLQQGRRRRLSGDSVPSSMPDLSLAKGELCPSASNSNVAQPLDVPLTRAESMQRREQTQRHHRRSSSGLMARMSNSLAERVTDESRDHRGFFRSLKLFRNRRNQPRGPVVRGGERPPIDAGHVSQPNVDSSDDILAKYRSKSSPQSAAIPVTIASPQSPYPPPINLVISSVPVGASDQKIHLSNDSQNVRTSFIFSDAKRKLRLVLSTLSVRTYSKLSSCHVKRDGSDADRPVEDSCALLSLLRLQLSECVQQQQHGRMAQLHETLRCVSLLDADGRRKLLTDLRREHVARTAYVNYLTASRRRLLAAVECVRIASEYLQHTQAVTGRALVDKCVQLFMDRHEQKLTEFCAEFQQLVASDEKVSHVTSFLEQLQLLIGREGCWLHTDDEQINALCKQSLEQNLMTQLYSIALYPNGEADTSRDVVLYRHMRRLAAVVTLGHRDLRIPAAFHYEAPWPSAQAEIATLGAFRTASDKVACVSRCCSAIMRLLQMGGDAEKVGGAVPAADDLTPVLVYVLIQARPCSLLSTIQYVDSFYGDRLCGQEQYWWIQFCSAVEFIKTMDY